MKFKISVLALLVTGLLLGLSGIALGDAVISLKAQNDNTYVVSDAANAMGEIPLLRVSVTNTEATAINLTSMTTTNVGVSGGDGFNLRVWEDGNDNGILDAADTALIAATAASDGAAATTALNIADQVIAAGDSLNLLITAAKLGTALATDLMQIVLNDADALTITEAPAVVDNAEATVDAGVATNVPHIIATAASVGSATAAAHTVPIAVGDMPNNQADYIIHKFNIANDDAAISHTLDVIRLTTAGTAANLDFANVRIYLDLNADGIVDATDPELGLDGTALAMGGANNYTLDAAVFLYNSQSYDFIVTADGAGLASEDETVTTTLTIAGTMMDGAVAVANGAAAGAAQTVDALVATLETADITGPPYGRPNGFLDAIKVSFTAAGSAANIDDSTVDIADLSIQDGGNVAVTGEAFNATYYGDAADNSYIYITHNEVSTANGTTTVVSDLAYSGGTMITSLDGDYALVAFGATDATDKAPPAPRSVTTLDTDGNGKIDQIDIQLSEAPVGAAAILAGTGLSIPGYVVVPGSGGIAAGAVPFNGTATLWSVTVYETGYDTGDKPAVSYSQAAGGLVDGAAAPNAIINWNSSQVPVTDGAAPTLVKAETQDVDDDGSFDNLQLTFSENVQLNPALVLTAADVIDNDGDGFDFDDVSGHDVVYSFNASNVTGLSSSVLDLAVNELGSFDTAVMPVIEYNIGVNAVLTDFAASANNLAAQAAFVVLADTALVNPADYYLVDGISPRMVAAETGDVDSNGKLDAVALTFSEPMGTDAASYTDFLVAGHSVTSGAVVGSDVTLTINETGYDTGDLPDVTYTTGDVVDANGASLAAIATGDVVEVDGAAPILYSVVTADGGYGTGTANNGQIDGLLISFSEVLDITGVNEDGAGTELYDEFFVDAGATTISDTIRFNADLKSAVIAITESGGPDTDALPDLTYNGGLGDFMLQDEASIQIALAAIVTADVVEEDGAAPAPIAAVTVDDDNDGYLDGVEITFSETPVVADTTAARAAITLSEVENTIDLTAATITGAANTLTIVGTSNMDASGDNPWDTDALPTVDIAAAGGIEDAEGNVVAEVEELATTDGAAPVLAKAVGQVGAPSVQLFFSEPVVDEGALAIAAGDVDYIDVFDDTANITIDAIAAGVDSMSFIATTSADLTLDHVLADSVTVVAGKVEDQVGNVVAVDNVSISDIGAPILQFAYTQDTDGNGLIDHIRLVFNEAVNDTNLAGYDGIDKIAVGSAPFYTVDGYTVVGINFTQTDSIAELATADLDMGIDVLNVGDAENDATIYLMVEESGSVVGDTGAAPDLGMTGGAEGSKLSDFTPNYTPDLAAYATTDDAAPRVLSATMVSETNLELLISEEAEEDLPLASDTFVWEVGNQGEDISDDVLEFTQPTAGLLLLVVKPGSSIPAGVASTIAFKDFGVLDDAADPAVANVDSADVTVDVTPYTVDVEVYKSITVLYPNGGEVIDVVGVDGTLTVTWDAVGFSADEAAIVSYSEDGGDWQTMIDADAVAAVSDAADAVDAANAVKADADSVAVDAAAAAAADTTDAALAAASVTADSLAAIAATELTDAEAALVTAQGDSITLVNDGTYEWKGILNPDRPERNLFWTGTNVRIKVTSGVVSDMSDQSAIINPIENDIAPIENMTVSDVPDDNGCLVLIKFTPAARRYYDDEGERVYNRGWDADGRAESHINSFQLYLKANVKSPFAYVGSVPSDIILSSGGKYILMAYSPTNGTAEWGIIASTKEVKAEMVSAGKLGNVPLAVVDPTVAKIAVESFVSEMVTATGSSIDNIAPSEFTGLSVVGNEEGVTVSWSVPEDHGIVGMISGDVMMPGQGAIPIYGVNQYEIYRKAVTDAEYGDPIGTVGNGVLEFIDDTGISGIEYIYQVKAVDGNPEHIVFAEEVVTSVLEVKPEIYALSKNFPNPFNPTTTIEYQIPTSGSVEMVIFNMAGQKVRTLVNEVKDAGFYKVMWDGRNDMGETTSSGLYFYKLISGDFSKIEKMTLIK